MNAYVNRSLRNAIEAAYPDASAAWVDQLLYELAPYAVIVGGDVALSREGATAMRLHAPLLATHVKVPIACL